MYITNKKIGFIGTGKMGQSLIKGLLNAGINNQDIYASDVYEPGLIALRDETGIKTSTDNSDTIENTEIVVLAVKPQILKKVLSGIADGITKDKLVISIAAGVPLKNIEDELQQGTRVVRVMPNIAATVAEAASAVCAGTGATEEDMQITLEIFGLLGSAIPVTENLMDAVTGLSGSGPAYIFPVIEAMADGAVLEGLDRQSALTLAAQTVLGAAKMVLETGSHPAELKDMVTSPGGTTIRGVHTLEESAVRAAFMNAVIASSRRSKELGK